MSGGRCPHEGDSKALVPGRSSVSLEEVDATESPGRRRSPNRLREGRRRSVGGGGGGPRIGRSARPVAAGGGTALSAAAAGLGGRREAGSDLDSISCLPIRRESLSNENG